jgi:hypothetical protein
MQTATEGSGRQRSGFRCVLQVVVRRCTLPVLALALGCFISAPAAAVPCAARSVNAAGDQYCEWRHGPDGQANVRPHRRKGVAGFGSDMSVRARRELRRAAADNPAFQAVLTNAVTTGRDEPAGNGPAKRRKAGLRPTVRGRALRTVPAHRVGPFVTASFGVAILLTTIGCIGAARMVRTRTRRN